MDEYGLVLVTAPLAEPILLAEAKSHIRVVSALDDTIIASWITASREYVETVTGLQLMPATWRLILQSFPYEGQFDGYQVQGCIELPKPPCRGVSRVMYADPADGSMVVLATSEYQVSTARLRGRVAPARETVWPQVDCQVLDAVTVDFDAGYETAAAVPQRAKQAIRLLIAHCYENRQLAVEHVMKQIPVGLASWIRTIKTEAYQC